MDELRTGIRSRLNGLAITFLAMFSLILTLSPTVRFRSWSADLIWSHWAGFALWLFGFIWFIKITRKYLNLKDPTLVAVIGLLIGWGILTIWRINIIFGIRQALWFLICVGVSNFFFRQTRILPTINKYKYLLLVLGLLLLAITFIFGTYPGGEGPRLWLGAKGLYFQPSELLKILLILYLAAYFSENKFPRIRFFKTIAPTIVLVLSALFILIAQRDLGTTLVFIAIYIFMLFIAFGKKRILAAGFTIVLLSAIIGYFSIDLIRIRFQGWILPWGDTQANSYQITQAIIAIAAGGLSGTGIGLGNPGVIPISHSDFIYSAIVEETGFFGSIALIVLFALIFFRGLTIAINTPNLYYRYLAAGLCLYLTSQAILIIAGNIRLLPITGVTLPFLSYGGSSLLITFISTCILLFIDSEQHTISETSKGLLPIYILGILFSISLLLLAVTTGWWAIIRSGDLQLRVDNPRHIIAARYVKRGAILDRNDKAIVTSVGHVGGFIRENKYPPLSNTVGFMDQAYGGSGLETTFDNYLSGEKGYPAVDLWFNYLLYDQSLPGRDIRLTVDLNLQKSIDTLLQSHTGSAIVINAVNGEILAIASHPYIDTNHLAESWKEWKYDPSSPFVNRPVQGAYPLDSLITPFLLSEVNLSTLPEYNPSIKLVGKNPSPECAIANRSIVTMNQAIINGCPSGLFQIIGKSGSEAIEEIISTFKLTQTPDIGLPTNPIAAYDIESKWYSLLYGENPLRVSPLRMAASASAIVNHGLMPTPQILAAVNTSEQGWVILTRTEQEQVIIPNQADEINAFLKSDAISGWEISAQGIDAMNEISWYMAGTPQSWTGTPVAILLVLEDQNPYQTRAIGRTIFELATK